jgi:hypothetical protein
MPLTISLLIFHSRVLARASRCEFIQFLKEGLFRFRNLEAFMIQKQVSDTGFLLVVPVSVLSEVIDGNPDEILNINFWKRSFFSTEKKVFVLEMEG